MNSEDGVTHVTPADGNVFADLGFDEPEARDLQARSRAIIEEKLAIKISLMEELHAWKKREKLKQAEAAVILGISRPRVSDVMRKQTQNFTIDALADMIMRTGRKVHVSIGS